MTNITSQTTDYSLLCGLEVHAELKTKSKMFCGCKNDPFGAPEPNCYTCPVCLGLPGALPVANKTAIEWTIQLGLALNCKINLYSKFDRKHYFYPDLPKGYQISQYDLPFCYDGYLETEEGKVRIHRIHLEEDTGKSLHKEVDGTKVTLVDFNRSSVPLVEIVSEADIVSPQQAKAYGKKLRQMMRHLDIADCDMEQGGMRLEANISLQTPAQKKSATFPDYKVEVKNINSFRFLEQAIEFEMNRQAVVLESGKTPIQETRGWNAATSKTFSQRSKETAEDYRYFPDPDLPPIRFTESDVARLKKQLPELPDQLVDRWQKEFKVETRFSLQLLEQQQVTPQVLDQTFKKVGSEANQLASDLVNKKIVIDNECTAQNLINAFTELHRVAEIDASEIESVIATVLSENQAETQRYRSGETKLLNFFIGKVMQKLQKKVDMSMVRKSLQQLLTR